LAEPSAGAFLTSSEAPSVRQSSQGDLPGLQKPDAEVTFTDMHDGPDYVDDWMEKNLSPGLVDFIRTHCTSFVRWDLLRRLLDHPQGIDLETLRIATGSPVSVLDAELGSLERAGLVARRDDNGETTFALRPGKGLLPLLEQAARAYDEDREFRFALVYSIVRATHKGAALE